MILYKNVDIKDLKSIFDKGILSAAAAGRVDQWEDGKRGNNSLEVVYLFKPLKGRANSYPRSYGAALLMVDIDTATRSEIADNDQHKQDYIEYITDFVKPEQIKACFIPSVFRDYVTIPEGVPVTWCDIKAQIITGTKPTKDPYIMECVYSEATQDIIEQFTATANLTDCEQSNYFVGVDQSGEVLDLYDINYIF